MALIPRIEHISHDASSIVIVNRKLQPAVEAEVQRLLNVQLINPLCQSRKTTLQLFWLKPWRTNFLSLTQLPDYPIIQNPRSPMNVSNTRNPVQHPFHTGFQIILRPRSNFKIIFKEYRMPISRSLSLYLTPYKQSSCEPETTISSLCLKNNQLPILFPDAEKTIPASTQY